MTFDYYYGEQAEQFSFIRIPRIMLTGETFSPLSIPAKVLYGVLLDRMTLSMKNRWFDEEERVYIIYQIGEIQEDLGFTRKKAMELLSELESFGLVEKKRRGHGLPNILYVKSFLPKEAARSVENGTSAANQGSARSAEMGTSKESRSTEIGTSAEVPKTEPQEVRFWEPLKSYTEINKIDSSYINSNLIESAETKKGCDEMRSGDAIRAYESLIEENIEFQSLLTAYPLKQDLIRGIKDLMLETVLCQGDYFLIASNRYPVEVVKSRFLKLNYSHIEYVMECLGRNTTKVGNIKKYLLAALFNAPSTIDGYYTAEVNHDMAM